MDGDKINYSSDHGVSSEQTKGDAVKRYKSPAAASHEKAKETVNNMNNLKLEDPRFHEKLQEALNQGKTAIHEIFMQSTLITELAGEQQLEQLVQINAGHRALVNETAGRVRGASVAGEQHTDMFAILFAGRGCDALDAADAVNPSTTELNQWLNFDVNE